MADKPNSKQITLNELARMMAEGFLELRDELGNKFDGGISSLRTEMNARFAATDKRIDGVNTSLTYKIDQLDAKADKNHKEIKADFAALRGIVGGHVRTIADHEARLTALEK